MCKITVFTNRFTIYWTCEDCGVTLQNPVPSYPTDFLMEHVHKEENTTKQLYDLGYNDLKKADELARIAIAFDAIVADIRFMPHTRNPEFGQKHLMSVLGLRYKHVGALGNSNYKGEGAIQFVNVDAGMEIIHGLLAHKSTIIMCACWNRTNCHRLLAVQEYERRFGHISTPVTKQIAAQILAKNSTSQMPLF